MSVSIVDLLLKREHEDRDTVYLKQPRKDGWHSYTWGETLEKARRVATFLYQRGLKKGDHVAIYSKNCAEWFITDFGITLAGLVNVPLFSNQHEESMEYVLHHAQVKLVFVGKLDNYKQAHKALPSEIPTVNFDYHLDLNVTYQWSEVMAEDPLEQVDKPLDDDIYTIIYSSGTSGKPKGAVYTHQAIANYLQIFPTDLERFIQKNHYRLISYLPLAHVYERSAIQLGSLTIPCDVSFVQSIELFAENLKTIRPNVFAAVPRVWGIFQSKIEKKINSGILSVLFKTPFISKLIHKKIKKSLGLDECGLNVSGAAHLPEPIYEFFKQINIPIQEGYGQTENLAYATLARLNEIKALSVGSPRLQVDIKLGENSELLIKNPCLMKAFYKEPEKTQDTITDDGWLKTGDIAKIDSKNRVTITGRLSETFKNQKGEFVQPAPIEQKFSESEWVEQLCLVGKGLARNIMIVTLSNAAKNADGQKVSQDFKQLNQRLNARLKSYEKIGHVLIVEEDWTPENNLLTPTLKVKRREIESKYETQLKEVAQKKECIVWSSQL